MTRMLMSLAVAALTLTWVFAPCPAPADETTVIYESKTPAPAAQEAPKEDASSSVTKVEAVISNTGYSVGLQGG